MSSALAGSDPRRILIVEDEPVIASAIAARLQAAGYRTEIAVDGPSGVARCQASDPDLVVLDVMLPGYDGLEVCRRIQGGTRVPVLMLTALDTETDLLVGLGVGADDYLTKPFSLRELLARIAAILRRAERGGIDSAAEPDTPPVVIGDLRIDPTQRRAYRDGVEAHLTRTEFDLLLSLARRPRMVHAREALLNEVWGWPDSSGRRTVDSHVKALRRKLGNDLIRTVHGVGYALEDPQ